MIGFGTATQKWIKYIYKGSDTSTCQGTGPQRPQIFWDLLHARTKYEKQQPNVLRGDETRCEEHVYRVDCEW